MDNFKIYNNMENIDFSELIAAAGTGTKWPKGRRFTVVCKGKEFKVGTYLAKGDEFLEDWPFDQDGRSAIDSVYVRELTQKEIMWETDGEPQYADPEFDKEKLIKLDEDEIKRREEFLCAVANLLNDQATAEALIDFAVKKKNGTLNRKSVMKIACSGLADNWKNVFAIYAKAKTDTTLSVLIGDFPCKPGDNDLWDNDFISTYHEGLRISEALKKVLENKE